MANLMTALGYDQYNLMGTSYGAKLAQVAVKETPDRIRSVILDGVLPITGSPLGGAGIQASESYANIFSICKADEACNAAYPNLAERFGALLDELIDNPIVLDEPIMPRGPAGLSVIAAPHLYSISTIDKAFFYYVAAEAMNKIAARQYYETISPLLPYEDVSLNDWLLVDDIPRLIAAVESRDVEAIRQIFDSGEGPTTLEVLLMLKPLPAPPDELSIVPNNDFIAKSIRALLEDAQTVVDDRSDNPSDQWVSLVFNYLSERWLAGEDQTVVIGEMLPVVVLPVQGNNPQVFIDYANDYLPEDLASKANALIETMTTEDLRHTRFRISDIAAAMSVSGESVRGVHYGVTFAFDCAEDVSFESQATVDAAVAAAAYPQLNTYNDKTWQFYEIICSFLPDSQIDPSFKDPIRNR